jgi:hypothetical protein
MECGSTDELDELIIQLRIFNDELRGAGIFTDFFWELRFWVLRLTFGITDHTDCTDFHRLF